MHVIILSTSAILVSRKGTSNILMGIKLQSKPVSNLYSHIVVWLFPFCSYVYYYHFQTMEVENLIMPNPLVETPLLLCLWMFL